MTILPFFPSNNSIPLIPNILLLFLLIPLLVIDCTLCTFAFYINILLFLEFITKNFFFLPFTYIIKGSCFYFFSKSDCFLFKPAWLSLLTVGLWLFHYLRKHSSTVSSYNTQFYCKCFQMICTTGLFKVPSINWLGLYSVCI